MTGKEDYRILLAQINMEYLPKHIAIIMDGNGRWASKRNMPRSFGHKAGAEALRRTAEICREIGIPILTVFAFSTENWQRPTDEVDFLMKLFSEYLRREVKTMNEQQIRLSILGEQQRLPQFVQDQIAKAIQATANNDKMVLNIAVNYGSRREIVLAAQQLAQEAAAGIISVDQIDEALMSSKMFTAGEADPDLVIRPSGEQRLSNFLLWQAAYSELYFADLLWPDFNKSDVLRAIIDYQHRQRRFGKVK